MTDERPYVNVYELDDDGVEQLVYREMNDDEYADWQTQQAALATAEAEAVAAAWVQLRMYRDRWLDQLQVVFDHADGTSTRTLSQPMVDGIDANAADWQTWREAMRDLPAQDGLDPVAAIDAARSIHATTDEWPAPWPQPPVAPVVHLT